MLHNIDLIIIFLIISYLDKIAIYLSKWRYSNNNHEVHHNARWFFIHFFVNLFITIVSFNDLKYCLHNSHNCYDTLIDNNSMLGVRTAIVAHLYHCAFFFNKLNHHDWTHHIVMVGITGPLAIYFPTKQTSCALWFMCGFPGMLDYGLLWLVKMNFINKKVEKFSYKYINTWIRSPGCLLTCFLSLPQLMSPVYTNEYISAVISSLLAFWNGQYYMMLTCEAYGKNLALKNSGKKSY